MKKIYCLLAVIIFFQSCSIQIIGITNDYKKLDSNAKNIIKSINSFDSLSIGQIYKINALQLKEEIAKHQKSIVYLFVNGCSSEHCKPLIFYENYAKNNGYNLYLVMDGYGNLYEATKQNISSPLFAIDGDYYGTIYREVYTRYFYNQLIGKPMKEKYKEFLGTIFFFKYDKLEKIVNDLPKE